MPNESVPAVILISAFSEWRFIRSAFPDANYQKSPFGEWFKTSVGEHTIAFLHGGWGKIAAAGSAQYVIDRWNPQMMIPMGILISLWNAAQI